MQTTSQPLQCELPTIPLQIGSHFLKGVSFNESAADNLKLKTVHALHNALSLLVSQVLIVCSRIDTRSQPEQPLCVPVLSRLCRYKILQMFPCDTDVPWGTDFPFFLSCLVLGSLSLCSTAVLFHFLLQPKYDQCLNLAFFFSSPSLARQLNKVSYIIMLQISIVQTACLNPYTLLLSNWVQRDVTVKNRPEFWIIVLYNLSYYWVCADFYITRLNDEPRQCNLLFFFFF